MEVKFRDSFYFSDDAEAESEDCYYEAGVEIDLDPYILALILAEVPHTIVKKGAQLPKSGYGYRVMSEEELLKEKSTKKNSAFDILDTIDFDEN